MNANIILSVKGRKVTFNPHEDCFKWKIIFPIERIEVICEKSHHFECIGYVPRMFQSEMLVEVMSNKWNKPTCDIVVLPMRNNIITTHQIAKVMFSNCFSIIDIPSLKIEQYIKYLRVIENEHKKYNF